MVLEKLPRAPGAGGPSADTVLDRSRVRPGDQVTGQVHVEGGDHDVDVEHIAVGLVTGVAAADTEFCRAAVCGPLRLAAGERRSVPFTVDVPWETPVTSVDGRHVPGMTLGTRTELSVAGAVAHTGLAPLHVTPLSSQDRVLDAFARLGFACAKGGLEHGRIQGLHQELPFFQELGFRPPEAHAGTVGEVGLSFVADRHHLAVVLEADRRDAAFGEGPEDFGRWIFPHETAIRTDWEGLVEGWLAELPAHASRRPHGLSGVTPTWMER